jgi:large subunit ribosomal protein L22
VPEAYAILRFSKTHAAQQIHKVLKSAVANAEQRAQRQNVPLDVDALHVRYAVVNEGPTLKRFTSAAMGRATPIKKRTSHVEIHVFAADQPKAKPAAPPAAAAAKSKTKEKAAAAGAKTAKAKTTKRKKA